MSEKPIERLNYFNGQRLEADDLRLEQEYHVRIQRLLMKSLFTPGVADGFDVSPIDEGKRVVVMPGLALDDLGRAIILVNPIKLQPQGRYLCVRYAEGKDGVQGGECKVKVNVPGNDQLARWRGPGRITSEPDFFWRRDPPLADTRELVIAELILNADCTVNKVDSNPRHRALPAPLASVRPISFEGEKDIDKDNSKVIRFFIKNRRPSSVTLYLKAMKFSTLYYRELASHSHTPSVSGKTKKETVDTKPASGIDDHVHTGTTLTADTVSHQHQAKAMMYKVVTADTFADFGLLSGSGSGFNNSGSLLALKSSEFAIQSNSHSHPIIGRTGKPIEKPPAADLHIHSVEIDLDNLPTGSTGESVRGGKQLSFFFELAIKVRRGIEVPVDYTKKVLDQLHKTNPSVWSPGGIPTASLDGGKGKPLTDSGTGPIRLDLLDGLTFEPDEFVPYEIELSVPGERVVGEGNGGCIQYNLYIE